MLHVKILGPGCRNCRNLEEATREVLALLGREADIEKVTDHRQIAAYGVMRTPGLVVDDEVVVSGRVPRSEELKELLAGRE